MVTEYKRQTNDKYEKKKKILAEKLFTTVSIKAVCLVVWTE